MQRSAKCAPIVDVAMLIRCPAQRAWEAFVEPDQICRLWLG